MGEIRIRRGSSPRMVSEKCQIKQKDSEESIKEKNCEAKIFKQESIKEGEVRFLRILLFFELFFTSFLVFFGKICGIREKNAIYGRNKKKFFPFHSIRCKDASKKTFSH